MNIRRLYNRRTFLIVIVAFFVILLGWGIYGYKRILDRQAAIDAMAKDGARWPRSFFSKKTQWEMLWEIFLGRQISTRSKLDNWIEFSGQCSDSTLARLADFNSPNIQSVYIGNCAATGKGLIYLRYLPNLNTITIDNCTLGDSRLNQLLDLPQKNNLINLYFYDIPLTEKDFQIICQSPQISVLYVEGIRVSEKELEQLAGLKKLEYLSLNKCSFPEESHEPLPCISALTTIDLSSAKITDATLHLFIKQQQLKHLILYGTNVTDKGLNEFHSALPNVKIIGEHIDGQGREFIPNSDGQQNEDPSSNNPRR